MSCSVTSNGVSHGARGAERALSCLANCGVICVVCAGNAGIDANGASFAKVSEVIVVGASGQSDARANFGGTRPDNTASNYGSSVSVLGSGSARYNLGSWMWRRKRALNRQFSDMPRRNRHAATERL